MDLCIYCSHDKIAHNHFDGKGATACALCDCEQFADEPCEADLERYTFGGTPPIDPAPMRSELTR